MLSLREQLEEKEEELRQLKQLLAPKEGPGRYEGFSIAPTLSERVILDCLIEKKTAAYDYIRRKIELTTGREGSHESVHVNVCRLRQKVRGAIAIRTLWGTGFYLDAADKEKLKGMRV